ncbi:MAG: hypothetical protein LBV60_15595 [Streptomyces sp.]|jgi:predicted RNase H-like nuclease (RuvC/YqgF family)|nr:hypothetical protein [Streptomyces sp.]
MTTDPTAERRDRYAAALAASEEHDWDLIKAQYPDDVTSYRRNAAAAMAVADAEVAEVETARDAYYASEQKLAADLDRAHREAFRLASEITRLRDRNRTLERVRSENALLAGELQRTEAEVEQLRTDRAAVLREAADAIDATFTGFGIDRYVRHGAALLRRMADEVQP